MGTLTEVSILSSCIPSHVSLHSQGVLPQCVSTLQELLLASGCLPVFSSLTLISLTVKHNLLQLLSSFQHNVTVTSFYAVVFVRLDCQTLQAFLCAIVRDQRLKWVFFLHSVLFSRSHWQVFLLNNPYIPRINPILNMSVWLIFLHCWICFA